MAGSHASHDSCERPLFLRRQHKGNGTSQHHLPNPVPPAAGLVRCHRHALLCFLERLRRRRPPSFVTIPTKFKFIGKAVFILLSRFSQLSIEIPVDVLFPQDGPPKIPQLSTPIEKFHGLALVLPLFSPLSLHPGPRFPVTNRRPSICDGAHLPCVWWNGL